MNWLLLIHQIPAKPAYFRAKIWRRLQQLGAVAIKQSVYAMPRQEQALEDLTWIVKEITDGGGEATMIEARFLEGLSDQQVIGLFHAARGNDYAKILAEARALRDDWRCQVGESAADCLLEFRGRLEKLRKQFTETVRIDFFKAPEQLQAEAEYTHVMDKCSFEVMVERFGLADPALIQVTKIIHDIDLKESAFGLPETAGILALLDGITATTDDDLERIDRASVVLDNLLAFFKNRNNS